MTNFNAKKAVDDFARNLGSGEKALARVFDAVLYASVSNDAQPLVHMAERAVKKGDEHAAGRIKYVVNKIWSDMPKGKDSGFAVKNASCDSAKLAALEALVSERGSLRGAGLSKALGEKSTATAAEKFRKAVEAYKKSAGADVQEAQEIVASVFSE